jgi:hypothetical protein
LSSDNWQSGLRFTPSEPRSFSLVTQRLVSAGRALREWVCMSCAQIGRCALEIASHPFPSLFGGALAANTKNGIINGSHGLSLTAQASIVLVYQNSRAAREVPFVFYSATFSQSAFISFVRTVPTTSDIRPVVVLPFKPDLFNLAIAALGSACLIGICQQLLVLPAYAPAENYCSAHFPPAYFNSLHHCRWKFKVKR